MEQHNRDALIAHIQALDTIIRNRNQEIAELRRLGETPIPMTEVMEKKLAASYKKGWKAAYKAMRKELDARSSAIYYLSEPPTDA